MQILTQDDAQHLAGMERIIIHQANTHQPGFSVSLDHLGVTGFSPLLELRGEARIIRWKSTHPVELEGKRFILIWMVEVIAFCVGQVVDVMTIRRTGDLPKNILNALIDNYHSDQPVAGIDGDRRSQHRTSWSCDNTTLLVQIDVGKTHLAGRSSDGVCKVALIALFLEFVFRHHSYGPAQSSAIDPNQFPTSVGEPNVANLNIVRLGLSHLGKDRLQAALPHGFGGAVQRVGSSGLLGPDDAFDGGRAGQKAYVLADLLNSSQKAQPLKVSFRIQLAQSLLHQLGLKTAKDPGCDR